MYGHGCVYCPGYVRRRVDRSDIFPIAGDGYAILENVPIGVCDRCGMRYYHSSVLKQAEEAFRTGGVATRAVPVAPYRSP